MIYDISKGNFFLCEFSLVLVRDAELVQLVKFLDLDLLDLLSFFLDLLPHLPAFFQVVQPLLLVLLLVSLNLRPQLV